MDESKLKGVNPTPLSRGSWKKTVPDSSKKIAKIFSGDFNATKGPRIPEREAAIKKLMNATTPHKSRIQVLAEDQVARMESEMNPETLIGREYVSLSMIIKNPPNSGEKIGEALAVLAEQIVTLREKIKTLPSRLPGEPLVLGNL